MAPLKASKLNLWALDSSSGACVSEASWALARGIKLNINMKSFLKRMDSDERSLNSFNHCIFWLRTKGWRKLLQKVLFNWFAKECLPRNASRQGCVGVATCCSWCHWTERQQEERLLEQTSRIYSRSVAFVWCNTKARAAIVGWNFSDSFAFLSIPCLN